MEPDSLNRGLGWHDVDFDNLKPLLLGTDHFAWSIPSLANPRGTMSRRSNVLPRRIVYAQGGAGRLQRN